MKRIIILVLWLATGFIYCTEKEKCCDEADTPKTTIEESGMNDSSPQNSLQDNIGMNYIIGSVFTKSSAALKEGYFVNGLKSMIADSIAEGNTLIITGYSYADELNPEDLALERAESIRERLDLTTKVSTLRTIVIDTANFKTNNLFAAYQFVDSDLEQDSIPIQNVARLESTQNPREFHFYIDTLENDVLDTITLFKLEEIANRIGNSFCTVQLYNAHSNKPYGQSLSYMMEEALIRFGMSPGRVNTFDKANKDNSENHIELIIKQ